MEGGPTRLGRCDVPNYRISWRLGSLMGEATVLTAYTWRSAMPDCDISDPVVRLTLTHGSATAFLSESPSHPPGDGVTQSFDSTGSPNWGRLLKTADGDWLTADEAMGFWRNGSVTAAELIGDAEEDQAEDDEPETGAPTIYGTLSPGQTVSNVILASDDSMSGQRGLVYFKRYTFAARANQRYRIDMLAAPVDPYIYIGREADGQWELIAEDDDSGDDLEAQLGWYSERDEVITIRASTYRPSTTGQFRLTLTAVN